MASLVAPVITEYRAVCSWHQFGHSVPANNAMHVERIRNASWCDVSTYASECLLYRSKHLQAKCLNHELEGHLIGADCDRTAAGLLHGSHVNCVETDTPL